MTKAEKGLCSLPGCYKVAAIKLVLIPIPRELLYCPDHWIELIGYMATLFTRSEYKKSLFKGINLHKDNL